MGFFTKHGSYEQCLRDSGQEIKTSPFPGFASMSDVELRKAYVNSDIPAGSTVQVLEKFYVVGKYEPKEVLGNIIQLARLFLVDAGYEPMIKTEKFPCWEYKKNNGKSIIRLSSDVRDKGLELSVKKYSV